MFNPKFTRPATGRRLTALGCALATLCAINGEAFASSHREAPSITNSPKVDGTDFYMFRSYEASRAGFVTMIANYQPLQDAYGGPNYFKMDTNALYEIHLDNNGDAKEDITFQFKFKNTLADVKVPAGSPTAQVSIPLTQAGALSAPNAPLSNVREQFSVDIIRGDRRGGSKTSITNASGGAALFDKPVDNIGVKTFPGGYAAYAAQHIYSVNIPGCAIPAKVFVGQRQEGFAVNLGVIFDLVNAPAAAITDSANIGAFQANSIQTKNITSLALEVHKDCLTTAASATGRAAVIGGWTTASLRQGQLLSGSPKSGYDTRALNVGPWVQVSRLGMPLVNEVVIGLKDKDRFNASKPSGDGQFAQYVTNPTLPVLIDAVLALGGAAPTNAGRVDLQTVFLTGIAGVNQMTTVTPSEMLRLNTAIEPVAFANQNRLGIVGEVVRVGVANLGQAGVDLAGFPNGRRPKDDVVDVSLVAVMGGLCLANGTTNALGFGTACTPSAVPLGAAALRLHDGVDQAVVPFLTTFPYLNTPVSGSN